MGQNEANSRAESHDRPSGGASSIGKTRELIDTLMDVDLSRRSRIFDEVERMNAGKGYHPSELVEFSVKISSRGFSMRRYGAPITWHPRERTKIAGYVRDAAPTAAIEEALAPRPMDDTEAREKRNTMSAAQIEREDKLAALHAWIGRSTRFFSCVAYDFDARTYEVYLFKPHSIHYLEDLDLERRVSDFPALAYIRSLEMNMDDPTKTTTPAYFKLKFEKAGDQGLPVKRPPSDILVSGFVPHPKLSPRVLALAPQRDQIAGHLERILANVAVVNEPVVKLVFPSPTEGARDTLTLEQQQALDYGVNVCLLDEQHTVFIEEHRDSILGVARAFGCQPAVAAWLAKVDPFDCFASYLGIGPDTVTIYYRSTALHKRKPAPHRVRHRENK